MHYFMISVNDFHMKNMSPRHPCLSSQLGDTEKSSNSL